MISFTTPSKTSSRERQFRRMIGLASGRSAAADAALKKPDREVGLKF
jgi:hypothetical protein